MRWRRRSASCVAGRCRCWRSGLRSRRRAGWRAAGSWRRGVYCGLPVGSARRSRVATRWTTGLLLVTGFVPPSCRWISSGVGGEQVLDAAAEVPRELPRARDRDRPVPLARDVADVGLRQLDLERERCLCDSGERHRAGHAIGAGLCPEDCELLRGQHVGGVMSAGPSASGIPRAAGEKP